MITDFYQTACYKKPAVFFFKKYVKLFCMEILGTLFESDVKVKTMRLFLFNPNLSFDVGMVAERVQCSNREAEKEIKKLEKVGLIKRKIFYKNVEVKHKDKTENTKEKIKGWGINSEFHYINALQHLLIEISPFSKEEIIKRISRAGSIKLLIISGVFIQDWESRADILIVGDRLNKASLGKTMKTMESEIGKELRYAAFETKDFNYRLNMCDKLIRDILDFPHKKLINKLSVPEN